MRNLTNLLVVLRVEDEDDGVGLPRDGRPTTFEVRIPARVPQLDVRLQVTTLSVDVLNSIRDRKRLWVRLSAFYMYCIKGSYLKI